MRGRIPKDYNPDKVITTTIECPNCNMGINHSYVAKDYTPVYGQCNFCQSLFRWSKTKCIEIIPANIRYQLMITNNKTLC